MKKFIDKYFPLKFKVRTKHFKGMHYRIQYCHYRFIPYWKYVRVWVATDIYNLDLIFGRTYEVWSGLVREAEEFAATFKKYEDITAWKEVEKKHESQDKIKIKAHKELKECLARLRPYKTKIITK